MSHPTFAPLLAGFLIACDPILLNQQTLVMTETLAAFLAILSLWCLARFDGCRSWFNAGLAGGAIGLAVLCRPTFLPWLGLVAVAMLFVRGGPDFKFQISNLKLRQMGWRVLDFAAFGIVAAAVISPWTVRNYQMFGKPIATTTHGGYTLWLGNNHSFFNWLGNSNSELPWDVDRDRTSDERVEEALLRINVVTELINDTNLPNSEELIDDYFFSASAHRAIRREPTSFVLACSYRLRQLWSPLPHKLTADESTGRRVLRYATAAWYCGVFALVAIAVWRLRWKLLAPPWIWGVLLCLAFTAVHTFYWTNLRMRAPLMPFVAIAAGAAISSRFKVQGSKLATEQL